MRHVCGGIGDLIQSFDSIEDGEDIKVFSHFRGAEDFFSSINANFEFRFFDSIGDLGEVESEIKQSGEEVNRLPFQKFASVPEGKFKTARENSKDWDDIIGIHPVGSKLSNDLWDSLGSPLKILPEWFVRAMIHDHRRYFIFGTEEELEPYRSFLGEHRDNIKYISYDDIWESLCHVSFCKTVIGVDSAIKSMSAASRIETIVFVGDYDDDFRDKNFIQPYVRDGIMRPIPFNVIDRSYLKLIDNVIK